MSVSGNFRSGFSFPVPDNTPRYNDAALGPIDRLRSWLGWTIEADLLFAPPNKTLRMESGRLLYGDLLNGWEQVFVVVQPGPPPPIGIFLMNDQGNIITDDLGNPITIPVPFATNDQGRVLTDDQGNPIDLT